MSDRTAVYRLYAVDGLLLYIGIAKNFGRRWQQHASAKPWWPEVQRQTVDWFPDRKAAEKAEAEAIRKECPRHNIIHTPRQPRVSPELAAEFYEVAQSGKYGWQRKLAKKTGLTRETIRRYVEDERIRRGEIAPTPRYLKQQEALARRKARTQS